MDQPGAGVSPTAGGMKPSSTSSVAPPVSKNSRVREGAAKTRGPDKSGCGTSTTATGFTRLAYHTARYSSDWQSRCAFRQRPDPV